MSSFFSQLQNLPNAWWQAVKLPRWPGFFNNMLSEFYRREDESIRQLNQMVETASQIRRNFLQGLMRSVRPVKPLGDPPAGVTVEEQPKPVSKDCHLPGG